MKIERRTGKDERRIATAMIVDGIVLGRVASNWKEDEMFKSRWANIVGDLCVAYFKQYGKAPKKHVEALYEAWAERQQDKDTVALVERFLTGLSEEYVETEQEKNSDYLIDLASRHFTRVRLMRLQERIAGSIDTGDIDAADQSAKDYHAVDMTPSRAINVLHDDAALEKAFEERKEPLFIPPAGVGEFFGHNLCREGFIALMGPEKRGKTTWLVLLAWWAMMFRLKVAFFAIGDESEDDMMLRFGSLAAKKPLWIPREPLRVPLKVKLDGDELRMKTEERNFTSKLTVEEAKAAFKHVAEYKLRSKREFLRLSVHANSTLSVAGINAKLQDWEREGWVPDVTVVDYLDIAEESGNPRDDRRHRIDATWRAARGLAQTWHMLLITAMQSDTDSYTAKWLTRKNFSDNKTKLAHPSGVVGLNQTPEEKERNITRLNWVVRRGDYFNEQRGCYCVGPMALGNPAMRSVY